MADHDVLADSLAAGLKHSRKIAARVQQARDSDNAAYTKRLYSDALNVDDNDQSRMNTTMSAYLETVERAQAEAEFSTVRDTLEGIDSLFGVIDAELATSDQDKAAGAITYVYSNTNGAIAIAERRGRLGAFRRQMVNDNKKILKNTTGFGSLTADSVNQGSITSSSPTAEDHAIPGTITFIVESESVDAPLLRISEDLSTILPSAPKGGRSTKEQLIADNFLTVDKGYQDGQLGIALTFTRPGLTAPTESGDAGNILSSYTVTTPKDADSDKGIFYFRITHDSAAPIWRIEVFKDSSRANRVGSVTVDGTSGSVSLTINCAGGTTIAFTFSKTNANSALGTIGNTQNSSITILTPRIGDKWTMTVTNDFAGNYATKIAYLWRASLYSAASESTEYTDSQAASVSVT